VRKIRNTYENVIEKEEEPLERPRRRGESNMKMIL
jgi:hypothetical protein